MNWKKGRFKENSKCVRCGKFIREVKKICDDCVLEIYLETVLTRRTLTEISGELGLRTNSLSKRIHRMKKDKEFPMKFYHALQRYMGKISP